jgi:quinoprotein relay system zinc metallohydrolase 2
MGAAESRIACAILLLAGSPALAAQPPDGFNLNEVKPGVFVHLGRQLPLDVPGHDDIANIGFIAGGKCVAIIDSGGSLTIGRELRAAVGRHTSLPICYVINTHVHVDHVLGNAAFSEDRPSYVGSAALVDAIRRSRSFFVREYAGDLDSPAGEDQVIGPDRVVAHTLTLDLGGRRLVLRAWPTAHTDCDLTIYDEKAQVLWTGDLLFRDRLPALDGSLEGWLSVLDEMMHMKARVIVPGHGPVAHDLAAAIAPERRYLTALKDGVRAGIARLEPMQEAIEWVAAGEQPHWLLWATVHPRNVARAYEELEWR